MENQNETITYPTIPDDAGFFFENAEDQEQEIETKIYENGNKIKQCKLPVSGKVAVIRELLAKDTKHITRFMDKDPEKYTMAGVAVAVTLDGQAQPIEAIEGLKMKDYTKLLGMYSDLNF